MKGTTVNFDELTVTTRNSTREKNFVEYTSKKALRDAGVLTAEQFAKVDAVKGLFTCALHVGGRWAALTVYKASAEKKYSFFALDLHDGKCYGYDSIKETKADILEEVAAATADTENNADSAKSKGRRKGDENAEK